MANPSVTLQVAKANSFAAAQLVFNQTLTYRTSYTFGAEDLPYGVDLYARVKYTDQTSGESAWSTTVKFFVIVPAEVIGVCMDNSNASAKGTFHWIDYAGNYVNTFNFQQHPTYANIAMVTDDASRAPVTLTRFPLFYIKTAASGPTGTDAAGKKCWWISDVALTGFRPAAAFKRSASVVSNYCYMGTFLGHKETIGETEVLGSKRGQTVLASTTKADFKLLISNRNNAAAGVSGYRMFDIWDLGVLRILLLVAKADSDTQTCWGDNEEGTAYPPTGSTNARAVFQGTHENPIVSIEDLWRCYWYHADCITINTGVVTLNDPRNLTTALSFGNAAQSRYTQPTSSGWIRDVLDCPFVIGNDTHDLMELFLPGSVVSAENLGTFSDYHLTNTQTERIDLIVGRNCQNESVEDPMGGIYTIQIWISPGPNRAVGSRLSKN